MIRQTNTFRDNQARYIRNSNKSSQDYFNPDLLHQNNQEVHQYDYQHRQDDHKHRQNDHKLHQNDRQLHEFDHLVPPMRRALKFTARATWFMMKTLVKAAFRIPRLFSKAATPKAARKKNPSPATAFPAP